MTLARPMAKRLIETSEFPFEFLSGLAERESWRKEVNRPIYHMHKWWAKRLGSVFRGILLGSVLPYDGQLEEAFYAQSEYPDVSVFDPFMGSGTTVGEAQKLGMTALGRDINPVACEAVRVALGPINERRLAQAFAELERTVGERIRSLYQTQTVPGLGGEVLYFFWVKEVPCPDCSAPVDLFDSYVFARNAYPNKKPEVQVYCPDCCNVFQSLHGQEDVTCPRCTSSFDPNRAAVRGQKASCTSCQAIFPIAKVVQHASTPPKHRLYAKLVLTEEGEKRYLPATEADRDSYNACERLLAKELESGAIRLPTAVLADGYNTRQAIAYNYKTWLDFFNARQQLALGWLQAAIANLGEGAERDALLLLFSGVLEFNNLFASYKGEGTGAVRHMFSHHVLKPERTPIEANVWGTSKSSGSFSGLYKSRILRALEYRATPFELGGEGKVYGIAKPLGTRPLAPWPANEAPTRGALALSCGTSEVTGLSDKCVDLVVTDPPFFDNVHYSELADFFFAWQSLEPRGFVQLRQSASLGTTRSDEEVQDGDAQRFAVKLQRVFVECRRVLKDNGLLVFSYHHSRGDGWTALADAIYGAGFSVQRAHPVRSEMASATPKTKARSPILMDAVLVCSKREQDMRAVRSADNAVVVAVSEARQQLGRLASVGQVATEGDRAVLLTAQFLAALGPASAHTATDAYRKVAGRLQEVAVELASLPDERLTGGAPTLSEQESLAL